MISKDFWSSGIYSEKVLNKSFKISFPLAKSLPIFIEKNLIYFPTVLLQPATALRLLVEEEDLVRVLGDEERVEVQQQVAKGFSESTGNPRN